jgi:hypothetical protein
MPVSARENALGIAVQPRGEATARLPENFVREIPEQFLR